MVIRARRFNPVFVANLGDTEFEAAVRKGLKEYQEDLMLYGESEATKMNKERFSYLEDLITGYILELRANDYLVEQGEVGWSHYDELHQGDDVEDDDD